MAGYIKDLKLLRYLSNLDLDEWKNIRQFLTIKYFNNRSTCIEFFDLLLQARKDDDIDQHTKEDIRKILFKTNKETKIVDDTASHLLKVVKEYIKFVRAKEDQIEHGHRLLDFLLDHQEVNEFEIEHKNLSKKFASYPRLDVQSYHDMHLLADSDWRNLRLKKSRALHDKFDQHAYRYSLSLDKYLIITKLKQLVELVNLAVIASKKYNFLLIDEFLSLSASKEFEDDALINLYRNALLILIEEEPEAYFHRFYEQALKWEPELERDEVHYLYTILANFCIWQTQYGKKSYLDQLYNLYKQMTDRDFILDGAAMSPGKYKNVIATASKLGHLDWAIKFKKKYLPYVFKDFNEYADLYSEATIAFYSKAYQKTIDILNLPEFRTDESYLELDRKHVLLKCCYEMNDTAQIIDQIDRYKGFVRSNRNISEKQKEGHINFIKILRHLYNIRNNQQKVSIEKVKTMLNNLFVSDCLWLLDKIPELEA